MDSVQVETVASLNLEIPQIESLTTVLSSQSQPSFRFPKNAIRTSLQASTLDAIFAAIFSITTGGILLGNFLVELDASPVIFGMLSSIPMLVNLIQPLGAYISERTTSRFQYSALVYGISRLLWLILVIGIIGTSWGVINSQQLVILTLLIVFFSHLSGGLGSASWMSWLAIIVPRRLRGRYFGIRNSATSLTNLLCVPLAGLAVSHWYGGTLQGYGVILFVGILFGLVSLGCQYFKIDVNPQLQNTCIVNSSVSSKIELGEITISDTVSVPQKQWDDKIWQNSNFWIFILYFSLWMLAFNLCAPFVNLYLLETLNIDVGWVTVYSSLQAGANLLMFVLWGKLADKVGNRPILIFVGIIVAVTPLLWFGISNSNLDVWLWLPLLHIFVGGTGAGVDLCNNNMQIGITPVRNQSIYFAIAAAIAGVTGALGTTIGGFIAQSPHFGGLLGLFALSTIFRLAALIPLIFVKEQGRGDR
ncbi:MFS transporter [Anabaena cylindrica FACHB-243]|uniref:Major facilitator superfamily MFS_1 n=1 Tax=Anabaena cylindrica (strain ATCC 27899 / PCC 7122) TaxID=272123 RepID=K9ZFI8_ANACC|nr:MULTISPECIES: MFS transporter [Anabaena]AFZ57342.1 major facilitator superfamily MFS_1 [Anabaena cylindrica PCC 7122]MBD2421010.1 MFS transporter [Anabaena cylindrica FACHB-243]MBY5280714.1 MFS transporter [Anabaena sp. CCAP 1446/1C]MBY5306419.1 MFS transporter [Anabaena sp. CCAP 1446/1C]MCM2405763.1 MFS transporter [Anabaena sp. CCAP 1446/1C]